MKILKKFGVDIRKVGNCLDLLAMPSLALMSRGQLTRDLVGSCSSTALLFLCRLEDLMLVPETELIQHNLLPNNSTLLERLLYQLGSNCYVNEWQLCELSQNNTMKETYNKILAGILSQRFAVSLLSAEEVLRRHQPSYKPLSNYFLIADVIEKQLNLDFKQVSQNPALLDLCPINSKALLQQHSHVAGRPIAEVLSVYPELSCIPHTIMWRWLHLLDHYNVTKFPLDGVVPWVLRQDLLFMAELVLKFLVYHPQWENIKSSHLLFEIFANPAFMNDLMKEVPVHSLDGVTCEASTDPLLNVDLATVEEDLEVYEGDFESDTASSVEDGVMEDTSALLEYGEHGGAARRGTGGDDGEEGTDYENSTEDDGTEGPSVSDVTVGVSSKLYGDDRRVSSFITDVHFQALPTDLLDISDKYITCYTTGNDALTKCCMKKRPAAEVIYYLQTHLKVDAAEVYRIGRHGVSPCPLPDVISKLQLLREHGFTTQQIAAAIEIFGYDEDYIAGELSRIRHRFNNYEEYWTKHPNVGNLLLYYVTKTAQIGNY